MALAGLDTMMPRVRPAQPDTTWWRIPDSLLVVAGVPLGATRAKVVALHGEPRSEEVEADSVSGIADTVRVMRYGFGSVTLYDDNVQYLTCEAGPCPTSHGLALSAPRATVIARLGRGHPSWTPGEDGIYFAGEHLDCGILFVFRDDRVRRIELFCDNS